MPVTYRAVVSITGKLYQEIHAVLCVSVGCQKHGVPQLIIGVELPRAILLRTSKNRESC